VSALARQAFPIGVAAAAFALAVGLPASDPDTYWHLASGQWMIDHRAILRTDIFSSTVAGTPYSVGEWLGEVVLALVFSAAGWSGLAIFSAALVAIAAFFLARLSRRDGAPLVAALVVVGCALIVSKSRWTDRPAIFTFVLFAVVLDLLHRARAGSRGALIAIPPLILLWANLHGGYAIGIGLVAAFTLEALVRRRADLGPFAVALVASVALSFLDPETFGAAGAAAHVFAPPRFISEELPPDVLEATGLVFALFVLATLAFALLGAAAGLLEVIVLIPLLWLALSGQRHIAYFAFAATPFVAGGAARLYATLRLPRRTLAPLPPRAAAALALLLCVGAIASAFGAAAAPDERAYPVAALGALRSGSGVLLNEYSWGGYLIARVPERKVFIDGRLIPFYPAVLRDYLDAVDLHPGWKDVLSRYGVTEVLLPPTKALAVALREDGWNVRASGPTFVLLAKP
jgi:hypothetical protein